jgi:hypothetical protein
LPFDAIVLTHGFEGLCPPGLGLAKYDAMSKAIMELVPRLIPSSLSPQVNALLALVWFESNNGYDYLWRILELTVPGFDPTIPIKVPTWSDADNIFHFAQAFLLFFRLQAKVKFHYDDRTRSGMFLCLVQYTEFADSVTTLLLHVNSYWQEFDNGYLPAHLRLHGLATSIHQTTQGRLCDIASPRVRFLQHDKYNGRSDGSASGTSPQIQSVPKVQRLERQRGHAQDAQHRGRGGGGEHCEGDSHSGRNDRNSAGTPARGRAPRGPGRLTCPDRNRRPFLPDVQCDACKRVGHVAKHCDMLATAICLKRYMKVNLSPQLRDSIEKEWLDCWKERLGNPSQTPRQILRAYVEELDITVAGLDDQMEWDTWDEDIDVVPSK